MQQSYTTKLVGLQYNCLSDMVVNRFFMKLLSFLGATISLFDLYIYTKLYTH